MNSVVLIGRLTRDPEIRYISESQMAVATFTVAIDRRRYGVYYRRSCRQSRIFRMGRQKRKSRRRQIPGIAERFISGSSAAELCR